MEWLNDEYYLDYREEKVAIFDKNGKQISKWFDMVCVDGLKIKKTNYYKGCENGKCAIFDINGNQISDWYKYIYEVGLINGDSNYYIAERIFYRAVFSIDKQITPWCKDIVFEGAVTGLCDFIIALDKVDDMYQIKIYNIYNKERKIVYCFYEAIKEFHKIVPCSANGKFIYKVNDMLCILDIKQDKRLWIKSNKLIISLLKQHRVRFCSDAKFVDSILECPNCGDKYYVYFVRNNYLRPTRIVNVYSVIDDSLKLCPWCYGEKIVLFAI